MKVLQTIIIAAVFLSCGKTKETKSDSLKTASDTTKATEFDYDALFKLESYLASEQSDTSKVQTIDFDCAVFIYPTDEQIEELKKTEGEDNFYVGADDSNFYQSQAIQLLDSVGIKTADPEKKQFLKFIGSQNNWTLDIRKKNLPAWNLIFFKKDKAPQVTPTTMLTLEMVKTYFDKK